MKPRLKFLMSKTQGTSCLSLLPSRTRPPDEFLCPISDSLMTDPVNLPSGHTFDRPCIEAAIELLYSSNPNSPLVSSFHLTPDHNLKTAILNWCHNVRRPNPHPISQEEAHRFVQRRLHLLHIIHSIFPKNYDATDVLDSNVSALMAQKKDQQQPSSKSRISIIETVSNASIGGPLDMMKEILMKLEKEKLLLKAVPVMAPVSSSKSAETQNNTTTSIAAGVLEKEVLEKLKDKEISVREEALTTLFESARISHDLRISLCNSRILGAVVPKLNPRHSGIQIMRSVCLIFILSAEPPNRVKIVQSGAIPRLVGILKNRLVDDDARDIAAGACFSLSLEEKNRDSIGSTLGAITALVDYFCEPSGRHGGRKYAGLAVDNLSDRCPDNISRLAKITGAVKKLLGVATDRSSNLQRIAMVVICRVAWVSEARVELIEAGAMREMVTMMVEGMWKEEEERDCLAVMYQICDHDEVLFKELAVEAEAEEVLVLDKEGWGDVGREMAMRMLQVIRREDNEAEEEGSTHSVSGIVEGQQERMMHSVTDLMEGQQEGTMHSVTDLVEEQHEGTMCSVTDLMEGQQERTMHSVTDLVEGQ